jgi:trigger factor
MTNVEDDMLTDYAKRILEDKNSRSRIIEEAGDMKLFEAIKQTAKIEAKSVSIEEFKTIAEGAQ